MDLHQLSMFLQGKIADVPQQALQVLDIVLRESLTSRCVSASLEVLQYFSISIWLLHDLSFKFAASHQ